MLLKILIELIDPIFISILLFIFALIIYKKNKSKILIYLSLIIFYLFNSSFFSETMLYYYENQYTFPKNKITSEYDVFIFGGGSVSCSKFSDISELEDGTAIRLFEGINLLKNKIYLSGKSIISGSNEAKEMKDAINKLIHNKEIILDSNSNNTLQQLQYISNLKYNKILLVSSASHIPRIKLIADKLNLKNYVLIPTQHKVKDLDFKLYDYVPSAYGAKAMKDLLYELFALTYAYIIP